MSQTPPPSPSPPSLPPSSSWRRDITFGVEASWWEWVFVALPVPVYLVAVALHVVLGEAFSLYEVAKAAQRTLCAAGDVFVLCYAPATTWPPGISLVILVNAAAIVSALACMIGVAVRFGRNDIVFRVKPMHWLPALLLLALCLAFLWGWHVYRFRSVELAFGLSFILLFAVDGMRFALACVLVAMRSPRRTRNFLRAPKRRAQFAPGVETGEKDAT